MASRGHSGDGGLQEQCLSQRLQQSSHSKGVACVCVCVCVCVYSQEQTGWKRPFIFDETYHLPQASLVAQLVKNPPAMQETRFNS